MPQTFNCAVVEIDMGDLQFTGNIVGVNGISMVLSGNMGSTCRQFLDRVVSAAVSEFKLERFTPESMSDELIAQTNAHYRLFPHQPSNGIDSIVQQRRIARTG